MFLFGEKVEEDLEGCSFLYFFGLFGRRILRSFKSDSKHSNPCLFVLF